jgi:hypothetical protein
MPIVLTSNMVAGALKVGITTRVDVPVEARFKLGQRVRARNLHHLGHTRLPRQGGHRRNRLRRFHPPGHDGPR